MASANVGLRGSARNTQRRREGDSRGSSPRRYKERERREEVEGGFRPWEYIKERKRANHVF